MAKLKSVAVEQQKKDRVRFGPDTKWQDIQAKNIANEDDIHILIDIRGDNKAVVEWINGNWSCDNERLQIPLKRARESLGYAIRTNRVSPAECGGFWARHVYREYNREADKRATWALQHNEPCTEEYFCDKEHFVDGVVRLAAYFDGGRRDNCAGGAWTIHILGSDDTEYLWRARCFPLGNATSTTAEMASPADLCEFIERISHCQDRSEFLALRVGESAESAPKRRRSGR